jgi:hypothetical protein
MTTIESVPSLGSRPDRFLRLMQGVCLVLGPAVFAASTFFWLPTGTYGATSGALISVGLALWTVGLIGVVEDLRPRLPVVSSLVLLILVFGAFGGAAFGVRGLYDELLGFTREASVQAVTSFPVAADVIFYWPGPLFPLSLLIIGLALVRTRIVPLWTAALVCAVGIAFPFSRIPRIGWSAHVVDAVIVVAFCAIAYLRTRSRTRT